MKEFNFEGKTYIAWGNILGGLKLKTSYFSYKKTIPISSHKNFYDTAKKYKSSCDVFYCVEDGELYMPLDKCLVLVNKEVLYTKHFKKIEEYKKWYQ